LRDSAAQGALHKAVLSQQGLIEEAGYEEQAHSYNLMAQSARIAADANEDAAEGLGWTAAIKSVAAVASMFTPGGVAAAGAAIFDIAGGGGSQPGGQRVGPFPA